MGFRSYKHTAVLLPLLSLSLRTTPQLPSAIKAALLLSLLDQYYYFIDTETMSSLSQNIKLDRSLYCVIPLQDGKTFLATMRASQQIWKINPETGSISVYAGTKEGGSRDGLSQYASFSHPMGLALMQDGCVVVADSWNHSLRLISPCGW